MAPASTPTTIVNHVTVDIKAEPEAVWRVILDEYVETKKFREQGYAIEPLDDPAFARGGYRMRLEKDGALIDERNCYFTERDDGAHRLSLFADYLSVPGGLQVYATYGVEPKGEGARYTIHCHSRMSVEAPSAAKA